MRSAHYRRLQARMPQFATLEHLDPTDWRQQQSGESCTLGTTAVDAHSQLESSPCA